MKTYSFAIGDEPLDLGCAAAIGGFDGLHLGHVAVIDEARRLARTRNGPLAVVTFQPPPKSYFQPGSRIDRLMSGVRRSLELSALGVDALVLLTFNEAMATTSADGFADSVVARGLGCRGVAVGFDFRFGAGRSGDAAALQDLGARFGFEVSTVGRISMAGEKVSSTDIRRCIAEGDLAGAAERLGRWWVVDGVVERGERRGRTLGFPTANLQLGDLLHPAEGVYACWARPDGEVRWHPGVASFGRTPTTGLRPPLLEVHLFDVQRDLYGDRLHVALVARLRPQQHFPSLEALVAAMEQDARRARDTLILAPPPDDV